MKTKRLVIDAMLVAMYFVLGTYCGVNLGGIRIALDALPIVLGAALFGPWDALIIGLVGNFLFQLAGPYGLSVTTPLWMLPDGIRGLICGFLLYNRWPKLSKSRFFVETSIVFLLVAGLTTVVMYVDCLVFKYSFAAYSPYIVWRCIAAVVVALITTIVIPPLLKAVNKSNSKS